MFGTLWLLSFSFWFISSVFSLSVLCRSCRCRRLVAPFFVVWGFVETPPKLAPPFSSWVVLMVGYSGGPGCTCFLRASPLRSGSPVQFICFCSFSVTSVPVQRWRSLSVLRVGVPTLGAAAVLHVTARAKKFRTEVRCLAPLLGKSLPKY